MSSLPLANREPPQTPLRFVLRGLARLAFPAGKRIASSKIHRLSRRIYDRAILLEEETGAIAEDPADAGLCVEEAEAVPAGSVRQ